MKKTIVLLTFLLVFCFLTACGRNADIPADETELSTDAVVSETDAPEAPKSDEPIRLSAEEKAKFYKLVEFDLPENLRDAMVGYMRECSEIKWTPKEDFALTNDYGTWTVNLEYKKGKVYTGFPYADAGVNLEYFEDNIVDGKYYPKVLEWKESAGVTCTTAIVMAYQQFDNHESSYKNWLPSQSGFWMDTVGGYEVPKDCLNTKEMCDANGKNKMFEAYASMQKGDIIYKVSDMASYNIHCRVLTEAPTIEKNGAGKIIYTRSYLTTIEQTNAFDKSRTDVNTNWYVDHVYSFETLYESGYIPLTLKSYSAPRSELEVPYLGLDTEITSNILGKGAFGTASIKSNFPLCYVTMSILDKSGNLVTEKELNDKDLYQKTRCSLRNEFLDIFDKLQGGDYTFVLKAGIAAGSVELSRVDFTYSK